jgi:hypothetical protein
MGESADLTIIKHQDQDAVEEVVAACRGQDSPVIVGFCRGCVIAQIAASRILAETGGAPPPLNPSLFKEGVEHPLELLHNSPRLVLVSPYIDDDTSQITEEQYALSFAAYCAGASGQFVEGVGAAATVLGLTDIHIGSDISAETQARIETAFRSIGKPAWSQVFRAASRFADDRCDRELEASFHQYCHLMGKLTNIRIPRKSYTGRGVIVMPQSEYEAIRKVQDAYPGFEVRIARGYNHWQLPDNFVEVIRDLL